MIGSSRGNIPVGVKGGKGALGSMQRSFLTKQKMTPGFFRAAFLLSAISGACTTHQPCSCSLPRPGGLMMNCSSLRLIQLPPLPSHTTDISLQNNGLTSVSPGLFDKLLDLQRVSLQGNPFHCDCKIHYLRNWLRKNTHLVPEAPTCASPGSVAGRLIVDLEDAHFSSCGRHSCSGGTYNILLVAMVCVVAALLLWSFTLAKSTTFTLAIDDRHTGLEAGSLRSLKPKHRKRLHTALSDVTVDLDSFSADQDLERPLMGMPLLPQVLDILNKKHNIKIKAT